MNSQAVVIVQLFNDVVPWKSSEPSCCKLSIVFGRFKTLTDLRFISSNHNAPIHPRSQTDETPGVVLRGLRLAESPTSTDVGFVLLEIMGHMEKQLVFDLVTDLCIEVLATTLLSSFHGQTCHVLAFFTGGDQRPWSFISTWQDLIALETNLQRNVWEGPCCNEPSNRLCSNSDNHHHSRSAVCAGASCPCIHGTCGARKGRNPSKHAWPSAERVAGNHIQPLDSFTKKGWKSSTIHRRSDNAKLFIRTQKVHTEPLRSFGKQTQ